MSASDVEAVVDPTAWARDELVELVGITSTSCEEHALVEHLDLIDGCAGWLPQVGS